MRHQEKNTDGTLLSTTEKKKMCLIPSLFLLFLSKQTDFSREWKHESVVIYSEDRDCPGNQRSNVQSVDLKQFLAKFRLDHLKEGLKWAAHQDVLTVVHSTKPLLVTHLRSLLFPKQLLEVLVIETRAWSILSQLVVYQCTASSASKWTLLWVWRL